ncbi:MAG: hypothetical protein E7647_07170 [Ruminococcaceae bacterium]|nr:hypothetical protein [Oscillospiraceae bacterium]
MKKGPDKNNRERTVRISVKHPAADMILIYRLTEKKAEGEEMSIGDGVVLSLTVTKIYCKGEKREVCHLPDVSRRLDEAERIFETVSRALVTPCNALEIVGDIIGIPCEAP